VFIASYDKQLAYSGTDLNSVASNGAVGVTKAWWKAFAGWPVSHSK
jgi:hypothetical protein